MTELMNAIQLTYTLSTKGGVPDTSLVLATAEALSDSDIETFRTSDANPVSWSKLVTDALTSGGSAQSGDKLRQIAG